MKQLVVRTLERLGRGRALATLLWRASPRRSLEVAAFTLVEALLPTVVILASGALVAAIPGAVEHGLGSETGARALWALAAIAGAFAAGGLIGALAGQSGVALASSYAETVHDSIARAVLTPSGIAELEDPEVAGELAALEEYERTNVYLSAVQNLRTWATQRLQGVAAFVLLLGFRWWAPLILLIGVRVMNWAFSRWVRVGIGLSHATQRGPLRRARYIRGLAVEAPAAKELRVFGLGGWVTGRFQHIWMSGMTEIWRGRARTRWGFLLGAAAILVTQAAVLAALGWNALQGAISVAALVVFVQAALGIDALGVIGDAQWAMGRTMKSAQSILALERRLRPDPGATASHAFVSREGASSGAPSWAGPVSVQLANVRFTYQGRTQPTLDGLSLSIPAGQSLAVVGENGAGKTTLIKLLCGLYQPDSGLVRLAGTDPVEARRRIGVIFQDFVRYELPLRANVGFGSPGLLADDEALVAALSDAGGGDLPGSLPAGWDTVLSRAYDHGADLSGGQWQKVALARALAAVRGGAGLLILDEPTANLDVRAETELFDRFLELTENVTTILVSHRLSSVRHADRIVVLAGGGLVEDGTHEELLEAGGRYARMYTLQAQRFAMAAEREAEGA